MRCAVLKTWPSSGGVGSLYWTDECTRRLIILTAATQCKHVRTALFDPTLSPRVFGFTIKLRSDHGAVQRYRAAHAAVWPEVIVAVRRAGVKNMRTFMHGLWLFMAIEGDESFDLDRYRSVLAQDPACQRWQALMDEFQEPVPGTPTGEWWARMEVVFDLDWYRADGT